MKLEIAIKILEMSINGVQKSEVYRVLGFSFDTARKYIRILSTAKLLREHKTDNKRIKVYYITENGLRFIELLEKIKWS